jgi:uncharacterized RDD family membrane protein YckC
MPCLNHPDVLTGLTACARCGKEFCGDCIISLRGESVCGACKAERVQDIKSGTSEALDLAGRGARLGGAIVDTLIAMVVILPIFFATGVFSAMSTGQPQPGGAMQFLLQNVLPSILMVVYEGLMLTSRGQTLGKMAMGIKVVRADGSDISAGQAWGRAVSRALMGLTQILGLVDVLMVFSKPRTTLHDRIAKTVVVNWKR